MEVVPDYDGLQRRAKGRLLATAVEADKQAMLIELIQTAIMIFGASVGADLTARWYLTMNPRYAGLHRDEAANGLEGQEALDAATVS